MDDISLSLGDREQRGVRGGREGAREGVKGEGGSGEGGQMDRQVYACEVLLALPFFPLFCSYESEVHVKFKEALLLSPILIDPVEMGFHIPFPFTLTYAAAPTGNNVAVVIRPRIYPSFTKADKCRSNPRSLTES